MSAEDFSGPSICRCYHKECCDRGGKPSREPELVRSQKKVQKHRRKIGRPAKAKTIATSVGEGYGLVDIIQTAAGAGKDKPVSQYVVGGTDEEEGTASERMFVANNGGYSYGYCHEGSEMGNAFVLADQFHNAHFQPDVCSILTNFVLQITTPISFFDCMDSHSFPFCKGAGAWENEPRRRFRRAAGSGGQMAIHAKWIVGANDGEFQRFGIHLCRKRS